MDRLFDVAIIAGIQTHSYKKKQIERLYQERAAGQFLSFDQKSYQMKFLMIGPQLKVPYRSFQFSFTAAVGRANIADNYIQFSFSNPYSDNDTVIARFSDNTGAAMFIKLAAVKQINELLNFGISLSHFNASFNDAKIYQYFRQNVELENRAITTKLSPRTLNIGLTINYKL